MFGDLRRVLVLAASLLPVWPLSAGAEVSVSVGLLPPHMDEAGEGRDADILRAVMQDCMGEQLRLIVAPFTRHWTEYVDKKRDAVNTVPASLALPGFRSVPYIVYQNGATVLASAKPVNTRSDLNGRSAVTFADGTEILGLKDLHFSRLVEQSDQEIHSNLLFAKRIDVILADGMIVAEYNRRLRERKAAAAPIDASQPVRFTAVFPPVEYHLVFREEVMQKRFDRCFAKQTAEGRIEAINHKYGDRYRDALGRNYLGY